MVRDKEMHLDRGCLLHAERLHRVEIGLHNAATIDSYRLTQRRAQAVEDRALHLVLGAARIDDLAADIADDPHVIQLDVTRWRYRRLHYLGEIAEMAEIEGNTLASAFC